MLILFVEDDLRLAAKTIDFLSNEGVEVEYAQSVSQAKHIAKGLQFDAIILDLSLPDGSGFELAERFASTHPTTPILFLSARAELDNKLKAFELGALDYLTKPFELAELAMRVKLLAVKKRGLSQQTFVLDTLTVNLTLRTVHRGERLITLSAQQWQLLTHLIEHSPAAVCKQHIIDQIWPDQDSSNDMYKMLLARLRRNIDSEGDKPLIQTIRGVGVALRE